VLRPAIDKDKPIVSVSAAPIAPNLGTKPIPRIKTGSRTVFTVTEAMLIKEGSLVSPILFTIRLRDIEMLDKIMLNPETSV
jgi:hypothetical protein